MPKKKKQEENNSMPASIEELTPIVQELVDELRRFEAEEEELKTSKKELLESYKEKLDMKTFSAALRISKIRNKVEHKSAFDLFSEILEGGV
jgi:secreted Zn-dependent insulinase-like peptidase